MIVDLEQIEQDLKTALQQLLERKKLTPKDVLVIGVSTSEVAGEQIGKAGNMEIAAAIYRGITSVQQQHGFMLAFQCCEHLNRALVVERSTLEAKGLVEVTAVPIPSAGGSMATYAYRQFQDPVLAESIQADAGVDIGDTFIGMHLKPVVVPVRTTVHQIGFAHVTYAITRPKLIGGERAVYRREDI